MPTPSHSASRAGVSWSGLTTPPAPRPTAAEHTAEAARRCRFEAHWRASSAGSALTALSAIQAAARRAHALAEELRSAVHRDVTAEQGRCRTAALALDAEIAALLENRRHLGAALALASSPPAGIDSFAT